MLMPYEPAHLLGQVLRRRSEERVRQVFAELRLDNVNPRAEIGTLDLSVRQRLEIARAVSREPKILLLDEPTSALSGRDVDWLGELIDRLRRNGVTTVFISHRMPEVRRFCEHLTVLRNGRNVGSFALRDVSESDIISLVIGRSLAATYPPKPTQSSSKVDKPALAARDLSVPGRLDKFSIELWPGDVIGMAGLEGMGQRHLFQALFGMIVPSAGSIAVGGRAVNLTSPRVATRPDIGISLVPEERKTEALALEMTGRENVSLPVIDRFTHLGLIDLKRETEAVAKMLDMVQVDRRALYRASKTFSGGNQQKLAIAKWLLTENRILLMYDPTRGVDVGTKAEIYVIVREYAKAGGAVLYYSTDIAELVHLCDEVRVIYRGREAARLRGEHLTESNVMRAALGEAVFSEPHGARTAAAS
jgi:ribose transport system ATP-binding protein